MANTFTHSKTISRLAWLKARAEAVIPLGGAAILPGFIEMASNGEKTLTVIQIGAVWLAALVYAGLVIWSPMALPGKEPHPVTWKRFIKIITILGITLMGAALLNGALIQTRSSSSGGLSVLLLAIGLGAAGATAECALPIDLFPILRGRQLRRVLYVLVSALFLVVLVQIGNGLISGIARSVGEALGEIPPENVASAFPQVHPLAMLYSQLLSAALEELFFRVGIMTLVWALTRRWGLGLLVSALLFGLYHIWPANPMAAYFGAAPVSMALSHFGAGLINGLIYRYRGFGSAMIVHGLGNWLLISLLS